MFVNDIIPHPGPASLDVWVERDLGSPGSELRRAYLEERVRAVLTAMREPTEAQLRETNARAYDHDGYELAANDWRSMIDKLLER